MIITPRKAKHKVRAVRTLWGGLDGDILMVLPVVSRKIDEWETRLSDIRAQDPSTAEAAPSLEKLTEVVGWIEEHFARMLFEGDLRGQQAIVYLLSQMYNPSRLHMRMESDIVAKDGSILPEALPEIETSHLVLTCGPRANRLTRVALGLIGHADLFKAFRLKRMVPDPTTGEEYYTATEYVDYGVALKTRNPFACRGSPQRMFVLAGCHGFGTHGAAAATTVPLLADDIVRHFPGAGQEFEVRCSIRNEDDSELTFGRPESMIRIVEPFESREGSNLADVLDGSEGVRTALFDSRLSRAQRASAVLSSAAVFFMTCLLLHLFGGIEVMTPEVALTGLLTSGGLWASAAAAVRYYLRGEG